MGVIRCCRGCKPPKRNPYCHTNCPEYLKEKAEWEELRQKDEQQKQIDYELDSQREKAVYTAKKRWRRN